MSNEDSQSQINETIQSLENEPELEYDAFSDDLEPPHTIDIESNENENNVRINMLEEELAITKEQMVRALAEAENARKRAAKDREDASKFAVSGFARDLISVADNLRRALDSTPAELLESQPQIKNLTDGIEATERELLRSFEKNGLKKTEPLNELFDPNFHEVMFEAPMPDKQNGVIIQVIEPGYTINGRILRPARVGIAKSENAGSAAPSAEPGQNLNTEA